MGQQLPAPFFLNGWLYSGRHPEGTSEPRFFSLPMWTGTKKTPETFQAICFRPSGSRQRELILCSLKGQKSEIEVPLGEGGSNSAAPSF